MKVSIFLFLTATAMKAQGSVVWQCDTFNESNPVDGCEWNHSGITWGKSNLKGVEDPAGRPGRVMRVFYEEGSLVQDKGGARFRAKPFSPADELTLEYEVYFSSNFDFVKGGKLPGFYGGEGSCTGGGDDQTCFSSRFMWSSLGNGKLYVYIPNENGDWFCDHDDVKCNFNYGHSFGHNTWTMNVGEWHTLSQTVKLNTVGLANADGELTIHVNGTQVYNISGLTFRTVESSDLKVDSILFVTFFGGNDDSWASTVNCYTYFRNFKVMD